MNIDTLVSDIYALFSRPVAFDPARVESFGQRLAQRIANKYAEERGEPTLRLSNIGHPPRKLWYEINHPELAEPLPPAARMKFLYGDILEEKLLFLAREAGHDVKNEQKEVEIAGVRGHIDGDIDDVLVDVKSASTFSFNRFASGLKAENDSFGYLSQLGSYRRAGGYPRSAFLVSDKTLGHICLDEHSGEDTTDYAVLIDTHRRNLRSPEPPERCYPDEAEGKSGNRKLGVQCSYCPFKKTCWADSNDGRGLRTFLYARGPVFFTTLVREPKDVLESTEGNQT